MKSTNTVAVRVLKKLGENQSYRFLKSLGITTLVENEKGRNGKPLSDIASAPLALGATTRGVSVREMTGAYTMLANGEGIHHDAISYTEVYDKEGRLILSHDGEGEQAIGRDTADIMTRLLSNVVQYGTASDLTFSKSVPVAGKTGTSNANTDRWFIGYTPELLCGIWYGHKDARDIGTHKINPAVTIFDGLVSRLYARRASEKLDLNKKSAFLRSENVISAFYCKDSGKAPAYACSHDLRGHRVVLGYFKKGTVPKTACDEHILLDYDKESGTLAGEKCPEENRIRIALVKNYARAFPCQIGILDAQFMYRHLPLGVSPTLDPTKAFFQGYYERGGAYIGLSGVEKAHNRYCMEHETTEETMEEETTTEEILTETAEAITEELIITESIRENVIVSPETDGTETTTEKKHLVPWW
jgi:penicillin-binding protein 1A